MNQRLVDQLVNEVVNQVEVQHESTSELQNVFGSGAKLQFARTSRFCDLQVWTPDRNTTEISNLLPCCNTCDAFSNPRILQINALRFACPHQPILHKGLATAAGGTAAAATTTTTTPTTRPTTTTRIHTQTNTHTHTHA